MAHGYASIYSLDMKNTAPAFYAIRRCGGGECEPDCNCHVVDVELDVDELTDAEVIEFMRNGTPEQRAEIRTYFAADAA